MRCLEVIVFFLQISKVLVVSFLRRVTAHTRTIFPSQTRVRHTNGTLAVYASRYASAAKPETTRRTTYATRTASVSTKSLVRRKTDLPSRESNHADDIVRAERRAQTVRKETSQTRSAAATFYTARPDDNFQTVTPSPPPPGSGFRTITARARGFQTPERERFPEKLRRERGSVRLRTDSVPPPHTPGSRARAPEPQRGGTSFAKAGRLERLGFFFITVDAIVITYYYYCSLRRRSGKKALVFECPEISGPAAYRVKSPYLTTAAASEKSTTSLTRFVAVRVYGRRVFIFLLATPAGRKNKPPISSRFPERREIAVFVLRKACGTCKRI